MTVRELMALLRFHDPDAEVAIKQLRNVAGGIRRVRRVDIAWRVGLFNFVELGEVTSTEAPTAVPVVCLWPE